MTPSKAIQAAMAKRNIRQIDLLDICGTRGRISEIVNGKRSVPKSMAEKLAKRLHVPLRILLGNKCDGGGNG